MKAIVCALLGFFSSFGFCGIHINEIHYHPGPDQDRTLEFIELVNTGEAPIILDGWQLSGGIQFDFPAGTVVAPGDYLVVCRRLARFRSLFDRVDARLVGDFQDNLHDDGETLVLRDTLNSVIETVSYHDQVPWPVAADGQGFSLQRICPDAPGYAGASWRAAEPTPLAPTPGAACPVPPPPLPDVVINEINYHPYRDRDADFEFVELFNPTNRPVDLSGWRLAGGIEYGFPQGLALKPSAYLVICRNVDAFQAAFSEVQAVGNFDGQLSNAGEGVVLLDGAGLVQDALFYGTEDAWPAAPDGGGLSLERISPSAAGEDPASWAAFRHGDDGGFQSVAVTGRYDGDTRLKIYLPDEGECIIDDVSLVDIDNPDNNLVLNGSFEQGGTGWRTMTGGTHAGSSWVAGGGVDDSGAMRIVTFQGCGEACETTDYLYAMLWGFDTRKTYRLGMKYRILRGYAPVVVTLGDGLRMTGERPGGLWGGHSAGRPNSVAADHAPPWVAGRGRFPQAPTSSDAVVVTVTLRNAGNTGSVLLAAVEGDDTFALRNDGLDGDALADDRVWTVTMPPRPSGSMFLYTIRVTLPDGRVWQYPRSDEPSRYFGYHVHDPVRETAAMNHHLILPGLANTTQSMVNDHLSCNTYKLGHFAAHGEVYPEVAVRFRGFTGCYLQKRHFKVRFNRGRDFQGRRKLNLNSLWTDKALVREHLAWQFHKSIGAAWCETDFVRLLINDDYYGFYMTLEHVDGRFLARNGLNPDGDIFKALMGPYDFNDPNCGWTEGIHNYEDPADFARYWEKENNKNGDFGNLADFVNALHASDDDEAFFHGFMDIESVILFQIGQVAIHNFDSLTKNHFLYHDPDTGLWSYLPWDLDLSFGKYFTLDAVDPPERPVGTLNDLMTCPYPSLAMELDFGASMTGCGHPSNWLIHYFFKAGRAYFQRAYLLRLWDVVQEKYLPERLNQTIDDFYAQYFEAQREDFLKWGRYASNLPGGSAPAPEIEPNIAILKEQIACHRDQLWTDLSGDLWRHPRLRIVELLALPAAGGEGVEFVELFNPDGRAIDVGGWRIPALGFVFPEDTEVPPDGVVVVAKDPQVFENRYGFTPFGPYPGSLAEAGWGLRLYDTGEFGDYPAVMDYLPFQNGTDGWPEMWRDHSVEYTGQGEFADNDIGRDWRRSFVPGGTPGRLTRDMPPFIRGDADQDGKHNLADPIRILMYVMGNAEPPDCLDSCDANNDGALDLADPISLLVYLFANGDAPEPPFEQCGPDTGDSLGCQRFNRCP